MNNTLNFKKLSDSNLHLAVKNLTKEERRLTKIIIEHIAEVDRRKIFLTMGYSSLFAYLTCEIGYSEGAAQRRIDAARLLQVVPEILEKIENGKIHLGQITKMQKICRQVKRESGARVNLDLQKQILVKLENKSSAQTDLILAQEFHRPVESQTKFHVQQDESARTEMSFTKEERELLQKAQEILSHQAGGDLKATILKMALDVVAKRASQTQKSKSQNQKTQPTATAAVTPKQRAQVFLRDESCQFIDRRTGKICGSKFFLQVDHIQPRWAGGTNHLHNLRAMCANHNRFRYQAGL